MSEITLDVTSPTSLLVFHSSGLTYSRVEVEQAGATALFGVPGGKPVDLDHTAQTATLDLGSGGSGLRGLVPGSPAVLRCTFAGALNDLLVGFYRAKYSVGGETRYLATTQARGGPITFFCAVTWLSYTPREPLTNFFLAP